MSTVRALAQAVLGAFLVLAGTAHLSFARAEFQAQVPPWLPLEPDPVVLASGVVEIVVGLGLLLAWHHPHRALVGIGAAALFVAVFPGNIAQLTEQRDAFGLTSDTARALRLLFQPGLVLWALWCTDVPGWWRRRHQVRS